MYSRQVEEAEFALAEDYADGTLSGEEHATVAGWITGSPQRRAQAAITAALRSTAKPVSEKSSKRRGMSIGLWAFAAAACVALLATLPLLHRRQTAAPVIAELHRAPLAAPPQPIAEDTILLQAQRLRGSVPGGAIPATYTLHAGRATRIQIAVPRAAAQTVYSIDLWPETPQPASPPVHLDGLEISGNKSIPYIEFTLPAGSLKPGAYEAHLRSANGGYILRFQAVYADAGGPSGPAT